MLISFGGLLADLVVSVDAVPERGADTLARGFSQTLGGGFAVVAAAARLGMPTALAGVLGSDPIADAARRALREEGIELLFPEPRAGSSGVCLVLVDAGGERTMVTVQGVESMVQSEDFDALAPGPGDVVYVNGYELLYPHAAGLVDWVRRVRPDHLVFDPGPLIAKIDAAALGAVLDATRWLSLNAAEATALTGEDDPAAAATAALGRLAADPPPPVDSPPPAHPVRQRSAPGGDEPTSGHAARTPALPGGAGAASVGVVVRMGAEGCVVVERGEEPVSVPAFPAEAIDTTGAGDTHVGAFVAALARGLDPVEACRWANAAAAHVVASHGQVSPPRLDELRALLERAP
ncbi:MAG TPA: PfkB family carbohydrate kinase [Solirubrobacterales bacterium]|nr:PfkB family carbohydrate kinase [Solirubrobacterales bacterium]